MFLWPLFQNDLGYLTFDLKVDLEPLFNWNVKQLFLYLSAEYSTPKNKVDLVKKRSSMRNVMYWVTMVVYD